MKSKFLTITLFSLISLICEAQIPNAGFETWNTSGAVVTPDSWSTLNNLTSASAIYTCTKGTPGNPGTSYLKLTSKLIPGMGVVPGIAVCGTMDQTSMQALSGFAFSQRPANFTGSWQHMIFGTSQGSISIQLTRWDTNMGMRMTVASANRVLSGMAMSWASFSIPLVYVDNSLPDSCIITLAASGAVPANNDYLWVDNLGFTGTVTKVNTVEKELNLQVFPNPATTGLFLDLGNFKGTTFSYQITDNSGKIVAANSNLKSTTQYEIAISHLNSGNYFLTVFGDQRKYELRFIKD